MNAMDNMGFVLLSLSRTLLKASGLAVLKGTMQQERAEMVLEKHGLVNYNYLRLFK